MNDSISHPPAPLPAAPSPERLALRRAAQRAAPRYDDTAMLQREVAARMAERLQYVKLAPARMLDVGCGTGADFERLHQAYPEGQRYACDWSPAMLAQARRKGRASRRWLPWTDRLAPRLVCADAARLPWRSGSFGLVWSNLMLHWLDDPAPALQEMLRVLEVGGLLMFSTLGPDTLKELRRAFAGIAVPPLRRFADMHDLGDLLVKTGFAEPVMDMEVITLTYGELSGLLADLRGSGSIDTQPQRRRGLGGRERWRAVGDRYEALRRDGRLPATVEVVYGHAWKPEPRLSGDGRAVVRFDALARRGKAAS